MNEDSPDGSPYGTLVKHDQSETKRDRAPCSPRKEHTNGGSPPPFTRWQGSARMGGGTARAPLATCPAPCPHPLLPLVCRAIQGLTRTGSCARSQKRRGSPLTAGRVCARSQKRRGSPPRERGPSLAVTAVYILSIYLDLFGFI
jgi:hypothetical protein